MKKLLLFVFVITNIFAQSCWNSKEKALQEEAELDGKIIFSFKDAVTCKPITNAKVTFLNQQYKTNSKGELALPIPPDNLDLLIPLKVEKNGYITLQQKIYASVGTYWQHRFLLSKEIPINSARFVLAWGETPKDLDLHLIGNDFHISYRNKRKSTQGNLDRDATQGYGPETITLNYLDKNDTYDLYVYNYSNDGNLNHNVNISVYKNNKMNNILYLPDNTKDRCLHILTIHNNIIKYDIRPVKKSICNQI